ncbi:MAG: hypothetical protein OXI96_06240 [Acidimicrobiaceae bacterium]|nr:hypothetical protein [Acidimicrobiaceae bacterium]
MSTLAGISTPTPHVARMLPQLPEDTKEVGGGIACRANAATT